MSAETLLRGNVAMDNYSKGRAVGRRDFVTITAVSFASVGALLACWPLVAHLAPNPSSRPNTVDVDLSAVGPGQVKLASWQAKPLLVRRWAEHSPWIVSYGDCSHCACILKRLEPFGALPSMEAFFCPCCASRFDFAGQRLAGPAQGPLKVPPHKLLSANVMRVG